MNQFRYPTNNDFEDEESLAARVPSESAGVDDSAWISRKTRIKFSLGGLGLWRFALPALVLAAHFSTLSTDPAKPWPPLDTAPREVRVALVKSHPISEPLPRISTIGGLIRYVPYTYRHFYVELSGCFEDYLRNFSAQRRNHFARMVRRFARFSGGTLKWKQYDTPEEMPEFHRLAREVSRKTYQERLTDAGMPDGEEFCAHMCDLAARDSVRGYLLFHNDTPIAYEYCPADGDVLAHLKVGYDPAYREHSPGNVLLYLTLQRLFAEQQFEVFDFGSGELGYKEVFATKNVQCADIYYFRLTLSNWTLVLAHSAINLAFLFAAKWLDRFGMRQRLKRLIRGHA